MDWIGILQPLAFVACIAAALLLAMTLTLYGEDVRDISLAERAIDLRPGEDVEFLPDINPAMEARIRAIVREEMAARDAAPGYVGVSGPEIYPFSLDAFALLKRTLQCAVTPIPAGRANHPHQPLCRRLFRELLRIAGKALPKAIQRLWGMHRAR